VSIATQRDQPNKELTTMLLLTPDELPRSGWAVDLQQEMPAHTGSKGRYPEMERAKAINSTASRRLFHKGSDSGSIFIEVAPLADPTDAESWVASTNERVKRTMSKLTDLKEFRDRGDVIVPGVEDSRAMEYSMTVKNGMRSTLGVAASAEGVYVLVRCSSIENSWSMEDVIEIVRLQIEKIRAVEDTINS